MIRALKLVFVFAVAAVLGFGPGIGRIARADDDEVPSESPTLRDPSFPKEPNKQPSEPVNKKTYVEGASEAPPPRDDLIPKVAYKPDQWINTLKLRWFYANHTQDTAFGLGSSAHGVGSSALSLGVRADFRAPWAPLSVVLRGVVNSTAVEARPSDPTYSISKYSTFEGQGFGGLRIHLLRRDSSSDLRIGADAGHLTGSYVTLDPSIGSDGTPNGLTPQVRSEIVLLPCLEFRTSPGNWVADFMIRYGHLVSASSSGTDLAATGYRRVEGEIDLSRYITSGTSVGLGVEYLNERATWSELASLPFNDFTIDQELRLNFFARWDF